MKSEHAVKAIILNSEGKLLALVQNVAGQTFYSLPGGRVQPEGDEHAELQREVKEETGLDITVGDFLGRWSFQRSNGTTTICKTFLVKQFSGELTSAGAESYEKISFLWLDPKVFLEKSDNEELRTIIQHVVR